MIKNYLKVAFRAIIRNKLSSFINIFGLALAMTCSLLIYFYIGDELSYDRYHSKADRIYRVTRNFLSADGSVSLHLGHLAPPFGPLLKNDFSEFEEVARTLQTRLLLSYQENGEEKKSFNIDYSYYAEPEILKLFDISVIDGSAYKALNDPFHVMLSETTAKKYFGNENALGKPLKLGNRYDVVVSGVYKDLPPQSHWHPATLLSFSTLNDTTIYGRRGLETNWGNNSFGTYVLVNESFDQNKVERQFQAFLDKHMAMQAAGDNKPSSFTNLYMQKLTDIHLRSHLDSEEETNGSMNNVYMMGVIGLFITLIACFNFINLSTARATKRAKEVGLRKVVGAFKKQLIFQYLSESVLIALFALVATIGLTYLSVSWLNDFTGKSLRIDIFSNPYLMMALVGAGTLIGILAGIYPAFVVSGFKPALILKGQQGSSKGKSALRKVLVIAQFSISIMLIIATLITHNQLQFMNNRDLGYNKDQVVTLRYFGDLAPNYDAFQNELLKQSSIKSVSRSSRIPTGRLLDSQGSAKVQKGDSLVNSDVTIKNIRVDYDFFTTYEIPLVAGRYFSREIKSDDSVAFILNEASVRTLGLTADEILTRDFEYGNVRGRVVGVVEDFHFESLHEDIVPMVFHPSRFYSRLSVKIAGNQVQQGLQDIENVWRNFIPHRPFEYDFLSMQYSRLYDAEQKQGKLFTIFAGLAVLIACLGLFGLATFNTLQRVKEIGIRKVLGASVPSILGLLSKEILLLIVVANAIAWPVAWYFMGQWLDGFAYHISMDILIYLLAGVIAVMIALVTVSSQTIKAAMTNPANTLRYE